jgi:hypothetical protein
VDIRKIMAALEATFTPKASRIQRLRAEGKSFNDAFAVADREYTSDGMSLKPMSHDVANLASGPSQMGEVQF